MKTFTLTMTNEDCEVVESWKVALCDNEAEEIEAIASDDFDIRYGAEELKTMMEIYDGADLLIGWALKRVLMGVETNLRRDK